MVAQDVLVVARRRAGLTQRELALRLGRPQSTIGRWETGARAPSFADVIEALAACDVELAPDLLTRDQSLVGDARDRLALDPLERVARLDVTGLIAPVVELVAAAGLRCVLVGQVAGALQGWPLRLPSPVVELVVDPRDRTALGDALVGAGARPGPVPERRPRWAAAEVSRWELPGGAAVELLDGVAGAHGYRDLASDADGLVIPRTPVPVASVLDLIRTADASHAFGGRFFLPALYAVLDARRLGPPRVLAHDSPEGREALATWLSAPAT